MKEQTEAKEIKGRILSRIQEQLNQNPGEEGMEYLKVNAHAKGGSYSKGIQQIQPEP